MVFHHMFGTIGIRESKRYGRTTNISISIDGNESYSSFLRVQKGSEEFSRGFYEKLSKNAQKGDLNENPS